MASGGGGGGEGETVLVTGASGFIGSCLVRRLLARGYSVHAAVLNPGQCETAITAACLLARRRR
jgi:nucleoside-diphosphate-sugar epimerase